MNEGFVEVRLEDIERLRAERDAARAIADKLAEALRPFEERAMKTSMIRFAGRVQIDVAGEALNAARAALAEYDAFRTDGKSDA